jgi:hypothetical protein
MKIIQPAGNRSREFETLTHRTLAVSNTDRQQHVTRYRGQEWPTTRRLVEEHLLPLMAAAGVRYLQVARHGPRQEDGIDILSDSRAPDRLQLVGAWTLADEMFDGGTVPQTTGDRLCSVDCTKCR